MTSAHPPLRWGLIGASDIASYAIIPALRTTGQEIVAVSSGNRAWADEYATTHNIESVADSFTELIARDDIDAVYISSTNEKHHDQVIAAAQGGKHILCEKPLATNLSDAVDMVLACDSAGIVFATNHHMPASAAHQTIKRLVADGSIGKVLSVRVQFGTYLAERLRTWRLTDPKAGAGAVFDLGAHSASLIRNAIGGQAKSIVAINTVQGEWETSAEDASMSVMDWDGNVLVQTHEAFTIPFGPRDFQVLGSEGALVGIGIVGGNDGDLLLVDKEGTRAVDVGERVNFYVNTVEHFVAAVAGEGEPIVDGRGGVATLAVALSELESARTGERVTVPRPFDIS
jgi:1,5-anhydro-D-fructose reductase (1,5-anhydro-D-mannitol-forming)